MSTVQLSGNITADSFTFYTGTLDVNGYDITTNNFQIGNSSRMNTDGLAGSTITASSILFWQGGAPYGSGNSSSNWTLDYQGGELSGIMARYSIGNMSAATNNITAWHSNNYGGNVGVDWVGITGEHWYSMDESGWYNLTDVDYSLFSPVAGTSRTVASIPTISFNAVSNHVLDMSQVTTGNIGFTATESNVMDMYQTTDATIVFTASADSFLDVNPSSLLLFTHGYDTSSTFAYLYVEGLAPDIGTSIHLVINPGRTGVYGGMDFYVRSDGVYDLARPIGVSFPLFVGPARAPYASLNLFLQGFEGTDNNNVSMYTYGSTLHTSGLDLVLPSSYDVSSNNTNMYIFGYNV